jgi:hypothetical protein
LLDAERSRLAYNAAYDICRHAAEAVNTSGGYRVTAAAGAPEATFALAVAFLQGSGDSGDSMKHGSEPFGGAESHDQQLAERLVVGAVAVG